MEENKNMRNEGLKTGFQVFLKVLGTYRVQYYEIKMKFGKMVLTTFF